MLASFAPLQRLQTTRAGTVDGAFDVCTMRPAGTTTAGPAPSPMGGVASCASRDPQVTQNRLPLGFFEPQVGQPWPSSWCETSKLNSGGAGLLVRAPATASSGKSAGNGITPSPVGGVGGTTPPC